MTKRARVLKDKEVQKLLKYCQTTRYPARNRAICLLSYKAGLRACEIASLTLSDVQNTDGSIRTVLTLSAAQTKGQAANRVMLSKALQRELQGYIRRERGSATHDAPLFKTQTGGFFRSATIQELFRNLYDAAGLYGCSSHSGRRTFITNLSEAGVSARVVQACARHKSLQTTMVYIELNDNILSNAVDLL